MPFVDNLEYLNVNSLRSYPIREDLGATDITGAFTIPNSFIVEFSLAASNLVSDRFYISTIFNKISSFVIQVSDQNNVVAGTFTVPVAGFVENTTYNMVTAAGIYLTANGRLTIGSLTQILSAPAGHTVLLLLQLSLNPERLFQLSKVSTILPSLIMRKHKYLNR